MDKADKRFLSGIAAGIGVDILAEALMNTITLQELIVAGIFIAAAYLLWRD